MKREMRPGDKVVITLGGVTHEFDPSSVIMSVDETSTRDNSKKYRYATVLVDLSNGEFPEVRR